MKRFLVFSFSNYYPAGGSGEVLGSFDSVEEAAQAGRASGDDVWEILDMDKRQWVDDPPNASQQGPSSAGPAE
jgi:hypothetical protein